MSPNKEDKNKQTSTPQQQRKSVEDREDRNLSKQRAKAKSPNVRKLEPLIGKSKSSLSFLFLQNCLRPKNYRVAINQNIKEEEQEENGEVLSYCTYTVRTVQHSSGYRGGGVLGRGRNTAHGTYSSNQHLLSTVTKVKVAPRLQCIRFCF